MSAPVALISFDAAFLATGIVALYLGAEALVEGASRLAIGLGLRAAIVGVTVVAFATTIPELFIAVLNGLGYGSDLGLDAVVGSNIADIGLVLGILALAKSMSISTTMPCRHVPFMIAVVAVLIVFGMGGDLNAVDSGALLLVLVALTGCLLYRVQLVTVDAIGAGEIDIRNEDEAPVQLRDVVYLTPGLLLLFVDLSWLIQGGQGLFESFGFDPRFIELIVLAFDTSLPKLAASITSVARNGPELSIGNAIGSNIYNVIAVLGILATMVPVNVPPSTISLDFPAFLVLTFGVIALMPRNHDVSRLDGGILIVGYLVSF